MQFVRADKELKDSPPISCMPIWQNLPLCSIQSAPRQARETLTYGNESTQKNQIFFEFGGKTTWEIFPNEEEFVWFVAFHSMLCKTISHFPLQRFSRPISQILRMEYNCAIFRPSPVMSERRIWLECGKVIGFSLLVLFVVTNAFEIVIQSYFHYLLRCNYLLDLFNAVYLVFRRK